MNAPFDPTATATSKTSGAGRLAPIEHALTALTFHDREWWLHEAHRLGSDWRGIAETAWLDPEWRRAALDYHKHKTDI